MTGWIKCSDSLPIKGVRVLICVPRCEQWKGRVYSAVLNHNNSWVLGGGSRMSPRPSHWKPLPIPPVD